MKRLLIIILFIVFFFNFCTKTQVVTPEKTQPEKKKKVKVKEKTPPPLKIEEIPMEVAPPTQKKEDSKNTQKVRIALSKADIKDVLIALTKNTKYSLYIEPDVSGTIELANFKEISLKDALDYILPSLGLSYKIEKKDVLHVFKHKKITRVFTLDFLAIKRKGKRKVSFSTRSQMGQGGGSGAGSSGGGVSGGSTGGSSGGGSGGQNESTSSIQTETESTVWAELSEGLKALFEETNQTASGISSSANGTGAVEGLNLSTTDGRRLIVSPKTGIVLITDFPERMNLFSNFLQTFEKSIKREVWIEAKILEVYLNKAHQMGVNWSSVFSFANFYGTLPNTSTLVFPSTQLNTGSPVMDNLNPSYGIFRYSISNNQIDLLLEALSRQGELKVLSSPRISTLNNEKAIIRVVREEVFYSMQNQVSTSVGGTVSAPSINVQIVPVGIVMDIIPQISSSGEIILSINPDISHLVSIKTFEAEGASAMQPVIDRRSVDTIVKVHDGETVVIGGIMEERKQEINRGVPFLMNLPFIGSLFRRTEQSIKKTELVILITPHIMVGKTIKELTQREIKRVKDALSPFHISDIIPIEEGINRELKQKEEKKK
jgi:MSHA biogenesis protein MshL